MEEVLAIGGFFITTIVIVIGFPLVRSYTRRKDLEAQRAPIDPENDRRLQRIEHAIEAMAIEVERISEGQRFVTKLLADRERVPAVLPPRTE
jgi:hypothetical protein